MIRKWSGIIVFASVFQGCLSDDDPPPLPPLPVKETSYANFKEVGLTPQSLPTGRAGVGSIRGFGDFSRSGRLDLFTATLTYWPPTTPEAATPSLFEIWKNVGSRYTKTSLISAGQGCIHPRKALVADFNRDFIPDIFVVCHGYDKSPFPGEKNKIVLSQEGGGFVVRNASDDVGFFHSGTAIDLNSDDLIDVILVNNFDSDSALVLLNKGDGVFEREAKKRFPASIGGKNYFSVEMVDVDGDMTADVILGGHEWEGATTMVLLNSGDNDFRTTRPTILPSVANEGVVLDFLVTADSLGRHIWVLRTSGGDSTFYKSRVIQKVTWGSLSSTTPLNQRPAQWFQWIIPTTVGGRSVISSEDASVGVAVLQ